MQFLFKVTACDNVIKNHSAHLLYNTPMRSELMYYERIGKNETTLTLCFTVTDPNFDLSKVPLNGCTQSLTVVYYSEEKLLALQSYARQMNKEYYKV